MEVNINKSELSGFVVDAYGSVRAPIYFDKTSLSSTAKKIFKALAEHALIHDEYSLGRKEFTKVISEHFSMTKKTLMAVAELQSNDYIKLSVEGNE